MDEKISKKPLPRKAVRTARTPRTFPGQPAEESQARSLQSLEDGLDETDNPKVLLITDVNKPEHVRLAIAKFETQELFPGSNMLVAGVRLTDYELVEFLRSLMTVAMGRGLLCRL